MHDGSASFGRTGIALVYCQVLVPLCLSSPRLCHQQNCYVTNRILQSFPVSFSCYFFLNTASNRSLTSGGGSSEKYLSKSLYLTRSLFCSSASALSSLAKPPS